MKAKAGKTKTTARYPAAIAGAVHRGWMLRLGTPGVPQEDRLSRSAEGADVAGRTVTLIEDVITTGGAVRNAAMALRSDNAIVSTVICAIDRRSETGSVS